MPTDQHTPCDRVLISFTVSTGQLSQATIKGWLTAPRTLRSPALQILVHGGTYNHSYWDWPTERDTYSYVEWAKAQGYATLAIDRLGAGESDHPPSAAVDVPAQAAAVRAVIAAMREGRAGNRFSRFILVGHSLGCTIVTLAAHQERVDALVFSGSIPISTGTAATAIVKGHPDAKRINRPAREVPGLEHLDEGYFTLAPEMRRAWMYWEPGADPAIIAQDIANPDVSTTAELATVKAHRPTMTQHTVPVLFHVGEYDILEYDPAVDSDVRKVAAAMMAELPANYACEITPNAGHCLTLHRTAREGYAQVGRWVDGLAFD